MNILKINKVLILYRRRDREFEMCNLHTTPVEVNLKILVTASWFYLDLMHSYLYIEGNLKKVVRLPISKKTKEIIINHKETRLAKDEED